MHSFLYLLKIRTDEHFGISKILYGKNTRQSISLLAKHLSLLVLFVLAFYALLILYRQLAADGFTKIIPLLSYLIAFGASFILTVLNMNSILSGNDDSEFILSTPINELSQVVMIFLTIYIRGLLYSILICVPAFLAVQAEMFPLAGDVVRWVVGLLCTCLPTGGISALIGIVITLILCTSRKKNQLESIIAILCTILGVFLLLLMLNKIGNLNLAPSVDEASIDATVKSICANFLFGRMYQNAVVLGRPDYFILFLVISFMWYIFFVLFVSLSYRTIVVSLRCPPAFPDFQLSPQPVRSVSSAIVHREFSRVLLSREILVKSLVLPILGLMLAIDLFLLTPGKAIIMMGLSADASKLNMIVLLLLCAFAASGSNGCCAYSSDGRNGWITASAPIDNSRAVAIKTIAGLVASAPISILTGLICAIAVKGDFITFLLYLVTPLLYSIACTVTGVVLDRRFQDSSSVAPDAETMRSGLPYTVGYLLWVALPVVLVFLI